MLVSSPMYETQRHRRPRSNSSLNPAWTNAETRPLRNTGGNSRPRSQTLIALKIVVAGWAFGDAEEGLRTPDTRIMIPGSNS